MEARHTIESLGKLDFFVLFEFQINIFCLDATPTLLLLYHTYICFGSTRMSEMKWNENKDTKESEEHPRVALLKLVWDVWADAWDNWFQAISHFHGKKTKRNRFQLSVLKWMWRFNVCPRSIVHQHPHKQSESFSARHKILKFMEIWKRESLAIHARAMSQHPAASSCNIQSWCGTYESIKFKIGISHTFY